MFNKFGKGYGWKPQKPDQRDYKFSLSNRTMQTAPPVVDLRSKCPPVYDQMQLGSCVSNGVAFAIEYDKHVLQAKHPGTPVWTPPSRLFIYYNGRVIENTVDSDSGLEVRDGIKAVVTYGDCPENGGPGLPWAWPYSDDTTSKKPFFTVKPAKGCYDDAVKNKDLEYAALSQNLAAFKGCLATGHPIIFGFTVYDSFESDETANTGVVALPKSSEGVLGGHCVVIVGYNDSKKWFIVRNSWGKNWGVAGYCYFPYSYILDNNLSSDFWAIYTVK